MVVAIQCSFVLMSHNDGSTPCEASLRLLDRTVHLHKDLVAAVRLHGADLGNSCGVHATEDAFFVTHDEPFGGTIGEAITGRRGHRLEIVGEQVSVDGTLGLVAAEAFVFEVQP